MLEMIFTPPPPNACLNRGDTALYGFADAEFHVLYLLGYFASSMTSIALISA